MNIGDAAAASGVSAKMIRHYEELGLIPKAGRTGAGYRVYGEREVHLLRFIRQSRQLGFSMKQIANLIDLWLDQSRSSSQVKELAESHMDDLDQRILELQTMKATLGKLVQECRGDHRSDCPILEALGSGHGHCDPVEAAA